VATGMVLRALRMPAPLVGLAQLFALLCLVSTEFTRGSLLVLPTPSSLRELGGVISAVYGLLFLNLLRTLRAGESAYTAFVEMMRTPPILYVNLVLFALLMWHAVTWFMLIGKAQPIQFTERPLPWKAVFGVNVLLWIAVSGAVVYLIFGGF